jgi:hypothetical protein
VVPEEEDLGAALQDLVEGARSDALLEAARSSERRSNTAA